MPTVVIPTRNQTLWYVLCSSLDIWKVVRIPICGVFEHPRQIFTYLFVHFFFHLFSKVLWSIFDMCWYVLRWARNGSSPQAALILEEKTERQIIIQRNKDDKEVYKMTLEIIGKLIYPLWYFLVREVFRGYHPLNGDWSHVRVCLYA